MNESSISVELKPSKNGLSSADGGLSDDSFFRTGDPNVDPVTVIDVMKAIPFGRFQYFMIIFYLTMSMTTALLIANI